MLSRAKMKFSRKAQAFVHDLIIALFIISIFFVIFLNYDRNESFSDSNSDIIMETKVLSDYLVSSGYPTDWNSSNVIKIGVTNGNNVLNSTKLDMFYNMTNEDYDKTKYTLGVNDDFLVFFSDHNGNIMRVGESDFIGKPSYNISTIESTNPNQLFKVSRFVVLKKGTENITSEIIEMKIYVWKKI